MPLFKYAAIDANGATVRGAIEGDTSSAAAEQLRGRRLSILSLEEQAASAAAEARREGYTLGVFFSVVSRNDLILMYRQMSALLNSGVPMVGTLTVLEKQVSSRRLRWILSCLRRDVESGQPLSEAMKKFPRYFPEMVTSMVHAGEVGGIVESILDRLANFMEERQEFQAQLISSMIYPAIVTVVTMFVVAFMAGFVIPRFVPFIKAQGGQMPWNTQLLVTIAENFQAYFQTGVFVIFGSVIGTLIFYMTPVGRYVVDAVRLRLPLLGMIFRYNIVVQFANATSSLVASGIPLVEAIKVAKETLGNAAAKVMVDAMVDDVLGGEPLSNSLEKYPVVFSPMSVSMVRIGEETGSIENSMGSIASIHEKMLRRRLKFLNTVIEPVMILVIASMIAFVAWSLFTGILAVYTQQGKG